MKNIFTLALLLSVISASALDPNHFTVTRISAPYFVTDGNSPATGPLTAYVGFKITNTSASTTYSGIKFTIGSITSSVAGQNYTMVSPASGITPVGTLAAGQSKVCYFYVSYPANVSPQATFNFTLSDNTAGTKTGGITIANRSAISANAGGLATQSINNQDLIGGLVHDTVTYTLGNIRAGDEADFQISVSTQFDPTKLILLNTEVVSSTVPGVAAGTKDLLYFTTTSNQSSGTVRIKWTFRIASFNFTGLILPYAGATSGSTNYKYAISTDLGSGTPIAISASANPLLITKVSDKLVYGGGNTALFTVTVSNPGLYSITVDKITDQIPAGFTYQALDASSQVTTANSTSVPAAGSTGTITFEGGVTSGVNTSYTVPATGSIVLKYTATAPGSQALNLLTTAKGFIGTTQFALANNTVSVSTTLPILLVSLKAKWVTDKVNLDWTTASENNSRHFEIERSTDNSTFRKIGEKNAAGNSSVQKNYSWIDSFPANHTSYYRLKLVDNDGKYKYSPVVSLQAGNSDATIRSIYPNPFTSDMQINLSLKKDQPVRIKISDARGQSVLQQDHSCARGNNSIVINNLSALPPGMYLVEIVADGSSSTRKVLKK
jgi:uncharacterized repeat protein (TIGR01451 family)